LSSERVVKLETDVHHRMLITRNVYSVLNIFPECLLIILGDKPFFISEFINDTILNLTWCESIGLCPFTKITSVPHGLGIGLEESMSVAKERIGMGSF